MCNKYDYSIFLRETKNYKIAYLILCLLEVLLNSSGIRIQCVSTSNVVSYRNKPFFNVKQNLCHVACW